MRTCGGVGTKFHAYSTLVLDEGERPSSQTGRFYSGRKPQLPIENEAEWVASRSGRFGEETRLLPLTETETIHGTVARIMVNEWNILATIFNLVKVLPSSVLKHNHYRLLRHGIMLICVRTNFNQEI